MFRLFLFRGTLRPSLIISLVLATKYKQFVQNCLDACPRLALHAQSLGFAHPTDGRKMYFESELPADMKAVIDKWDRYAKLNELETEEE